MTPRFQRMSLSYMWRGFKFCPRFDETGKACRWEATCYRESHEEKTPCKRTMGFQDADGENLALHRLRTWCIAGRFCTDRLAHKGLPYWPAVSEMPTMAELEAAPLDVKKAA